MEKKRPRIKKTTVAGGIVAIGIVIGALLSGLIPGFGSGSGIGDGTQVGVNTTNKSTDIIEPDENTEITTATADTLMPKENQALVVVIKDKDYFVRRLTDGKDEVVPSDLEKIVEISKNTKGNEDGIRVIILRDETARYLTWTTLKDELTKAGLSADSIELSRFSSKD